MMPSNNLNSEQACNKEHVSSLGLYVIQPRMQLLTALHCDPNACGQALTID